MPERGAGGRGGGWRGRWGRGRGAQRRRDGVTRSRVGGGPRASGGGATRAPRPRSPTPEPASFRAAAGGALSSTSSRETVSGRGTQRGSEGCKQGDGVAPSARPPPVPPGRAAALGCARPAAPAPRPLCFCFAGARVQRARVASRAGAGGGGGGALGCGDARAPRSRLPRRPAGGAGARGRAPRTDPGRVPGPGRAGGVRGRPSSGSGGAAPPRRFQSAVPAFRGAASSVRPGPPACAGEVGNGSDFTGLCVRVCGRAETWAPSLTLAARC